MADPLPLETPFSTYPDPQVLNTIVIDVVDPRKTGFVAPQIGTPHPNYKSWPEHKLVKLEAQGDDRLVRYFANTPVGEDSYNYSISYSGEDITKPIILRHYLVPRESYVPLAKESKNTGVFLVAVTSGGTGFNPKVPPSVVISGDGSGATAIATVNAAGEVTHIQVTSEGSGFTSATVSITGGGTGATAAAVLQHEHAYLIKEQAEELPPDDPRRSLFLRVVRVWETLPGPYLVEWQYIPRIRKKARITKRIILTSSIPADPNAITEANGTITEYSPLPDKYRSLEIISTIGSTPPDDFVFYGTVNAVFPDVLNSVTLIYRGTLVGDDSFDYAIGADVRVTDGYAGPAKARITEIYSFNPNEAWFNSLPQITPIRPTRGTIWGSFQAAIGGNARADVATFSIPSTIHPAISVGKDGPTPGFSVDGTSGLAATVPPSIAQGAYIVKDVTITPFDFGLWIARVIEVQNPVNP